MRDVTAYEAALLEQVARLRAENDALRTVNNEALKAACANNARLRAEVETLRRVRAVSLELREAERRTEAECSGGDMGHPLVSKAHHDEMRVRERWRAALDAANRGE